MCNVLVTSIEHVFSVEVITSTTMLGMHLLAKFSSSCETEVGNIHNTFVLAIKKDDNGLHRCRLSLRISAAFFPISNFCIGNKFAYGALL